MLKLAVKVNLNQVYHFRSTSGQGGKMNCDNATQFRK